MALTDHECTGMLKRYFIRYCFVPILCCTTVPLAGIIGCAPRGAQHSANHTFEESSPSIQTKLLLRRTCAASEKTGRDVPSVPSSWNATAFHPSLPTFWTLSADGVTGPADLWRFIAEGDRNVRQSLPAVWSFSPASGDINVRSTEQAQAPLLSTTLRGRVKRGASSGPAILTETYRLPGFPEEDIVHTPVVVFVLQGTELMDRLERLNRCTVAALKEL